MRNSNDSRGAAGIPTNSISAPSLPSGSLRFAALRRSFGKQLRCTMVLPAEVTQIKEEKEYYEYDAYEEPTCEIQVKVEKIEESPQSDWCIGYESNSKNYEHFSNPYSDVVDYDELTEYGLEVCKFCNQLFMDRYSLLCHNLKHLTLKLAPVTIQEYRCLLCLQHFGDQTHFKDHLKGNCQNDIQLVNQYLHIRKSKSLHRCHVCSKVFTYKAWHGHLTQVHGDAKFQCDLCGMKFKAKRYLRRHILYVHEGLLRHGPKKTTKATEDVKCSQCPAVFKHKISLHLHVKNCHCEKVQCDKCLSILKKSNLPNHIRRVHYNDGKVHKCYCGKTFRSPRYLKVHVKNSHSNKNK
ncbi:hypothetical protein evm_006931 [Chilo suppressalis]|nr:hypothetical protein evm_006931 [Chilo suppressalis]